MPTDQVVISMDTEWVPDSVLADVLDLLEEFDLLATLFSTHNDPFKTRHERALHPNFDKKHDPETQFIDLLDSFPDAIGYRSHSLLNSTPIRQIATNVGMNYESNYLAYKIPNLRPFEMPSGIVQFPIYWEDDIWFSMNDANQISMESLLSPNGMKVFNFHPNHICFNTPSKSYYEKHKESYYSETPDIQSLRYQGYGTRNVFFDLADELNRSSIQTATIREIYMDGSV